MVLRFEANLWLWIRSPVINSVVATEANLTALMKHSGVTSLIPRRNVGMFFDTLDGTFSSIVIIPSP